MKLDSTNFPHAGMKDLVFETEDGTLHKGCYDFKAIQIEGSGEWCRRWIDEDKNVYHSGQVINWWR